jgi:hypothetical protein
MENGELGKLTQQGISAEGQALAPELEIIK